MNNTFKIVFTLIFVGALFANTADALNTQAKGINTPDGQRPLGLIYYDGSPVVGTIPVSTQGIPKNARQNDPQVIARGEPIAKHNYSLHMLARYAILQRTKHCWWKNGSLDRNIEHCDGNTRIAQTLPNFYLQSMAWATTKDITGHAVCQIKHSGVGCPAAYGQPGTPHYTHGQYKAKDEFQRQKELQTFIASEQGALNRQIDAQSLPETLTFVATVDKYGEYDFSKQSVPLRFNLPYEKLALLLQVDWRQSGSDPRGLNKVVGLAARGTKKYPTISGGGMSAASHIAMSEFEKFGKKQVGRYDWKISPDKAQQLFSRDNQKRLYAVVKMRLHKKFPINTQSFHGNGALTYSFVENKVSFVRGDNLEQELFQLPLYTDVRPPKNDSANVYRLDANQQILDKNYYVRLALQEQPVDEDAVLTFIRNIMMQEQGTWRNVDSAKASLANPNFDKRQAEVVHYSWNKVKNNPALRNAYLDYFTRLNLRPTSPDGARVAWPESFDRSYYGYNVVTVYERHEVPAQQQLNQYSPTSSQIATAREILQAIAKRYPVKPAVLVMDAQAAYDYGKEALVPKLGHFAEDPFMQYVDSYPKYAKKDNGYYRAVPSKYKNSMVVGALESPWGLVPVDRVTDRNSVPENQARYIRPPFHFTQGPTIRKVTFLALSNKPQFDAIPLSAADYEKLQNVPTRKPFRVVIEFSAFTPEFHTARDQSDKKIANIDIYSSAVQRVLVIDKQDRIIWEKSGSQLSQASAGKELVNKDEGKTLKNVSSFSSKLYPFLLAKYQSQALDSSMLKALLGNRWQYETSVSSPLGGRFFKNIKSAPTASELAKAEALYRDWLIKLSATLPDRFSTEMQVVSNAHDVSVSGTCVNAELDPDAPKRSNSDQMQANRNAQHCRTENSQAMAKFDRCETNRQAFFNAQSELAKQEKAGCILEPEETSETSSTAATPEGSSRCDIQAPINLQTIGQQMQACVMKECGKYMQSDMAKFQQCAQEISQEAQGLMKQAMGMHLPTKQKNKKKSSRPTNQCKPLENKVKQYQNQLRSNNCDQYAQAPEQKDCDALAVVKQVEAVTFKAVTFQNNYSCDLMGEEHKQQNPAQIKISSAKEYKPITPEVTLRTPGWKVPYTEGRSLSRDSLTLEFSIKNVKVEADRSMQIEAILH